MSESFRIDIDQIHDENYGSSRLIVVLLFDSTILYSVFTKKVGFFGGHNWHVLIKFDLSRKNVVLFFMLKNENSKLQCKSNIDARLIFNFSLLALNVLIFKKLPTTSYFGLFFERLKLKRRKRFERQIFFYYFLQGKNK